MSDAPLCHYEVSEGVALLTLNRPNRLNAMTGEMEIEVYERLLEADAAPDVRAIVITGAGAGFCVGADLVAVNEPDAEPLPNTRLPATTLLDIRKPMIAAVNGSCAGWGFAFAMHCDYRFAAENVKFTTAFAQRGLIAEYGVAWQLLQIAGRAVALDLLLSARVLRSEEMLQLGLVNEVVSAGSLLDTALATARSLAQDSSPASMATIKKQVADAAILSARDALLAAESLMYESIDGADVAEGFRSFLEKRPPLFPALGEGTTYDWMSRSVDD